MHEMKLLEMVPACVTFGFRHLKYIRAFKYNHGACSISSVPLLTFNSYVIIHTYMHELYIHLSCVNGASLKFGVIILITLELFQLLFICTYTHQC